MIDWIQGIRMQGIPVPEDPGILVGVDAGIDDGKIKGRAIYDPVGFKPGPGPWMYGDASTDLTGTVIT